MGTKVKSSFVNQIFESESSYSEWFGYYNFSPFSRDNKLLLCHRADIDSIPESKGQQVEIGFYTLEDNCWHHIGYSDSWNWQQGTMLQWVPSREGVVVYNCSKNNRLISKMFNIYTKEVKEVCFPIYGLTPDGRHSISIDLERSYWCRAYHYQSVANVEKEGRVYENDGIYDVDLDNNTYRKIISIQEVINSDYDKEFENKKHWLEHVMISPSGSRFCFLHRFSSMENVMDYGTRVCIADIDGNNLKVVNGWQKLDWSHFGWRDDTSFVIYTYNKGYARHIPSLGYIFRKKPFHLHLLFIRVLLTFIVRFPKRLRNKILGVSSYYQYYTINDEGEIVLTCIFNNKEFNIDGHPSFERDGRFMITDTYPDKNSLQHLYAFNRETRTVQDLITLSSSIGKGNESCDLHPKLSYDNKLLSIDSDYKGRRKVLCFTIDWDNLTKP